jgi:hypothetical protein
MMFSGWGIFLSRRCLRVQAIEFRLVSHLEFSHKAINKIYCALRAKTNSAKIELNKLFCLYSLSGSNNQRSAG